jgi:peptide/nickel transport system permease protein
MLGNFATPDSIAALRQRLGLDRSIWEQFLIYIGNVFQGDLGVSLYTSSPVLTDLSQKAPATLELIIYAMIGTVIIGVTVAVVSVVKAGGVVDYGSRIYGLAAGAIPDFWVALLLIFFLFYMAGIAPAPFGRIDPMVLPPPAITGFYTIDSLLAGDLAAFKSSVSRLALPVLTLVIVNAGMIMKITKTTFADIYRSEFIRHQRISGLPERVIMRNALRNSLPPIITTIGFLFGFLLGGAVLVETLFSWGGLGQYAVTAVINSDYPALQGFVLVTSAFILVIYLVVDVLYELVDPRIEV